MSNLLEAYKQTHYKCPDLGIVIKINEKNLLLDKYLTENGYMTYSFITAWNPFSKQLTPADNSNRNSQLEMDLKGLTFFEGIGIDPEGLWPGEESFLVFDVSEENANGLMVKYEQNAIVFGDRGYAPRILLHPSFNLA